MELPPKLRRVIVAVLSVLTVCLIALAGYVAGGRAAAKPETPPSAEAPIAAEPEPEPEPEPAPEPDIPALAQSVLYLEVYDEAGYALASASGFLIDENTLVTNYHVIDGAYSLAAFTPDLETCVEFRALLAYDADADLAILRSAHSPDAAVLPLADSDGVRQGDRVYAAGYPLGLANTLSEGIVGAVYELDGYRLIQISAPISQGSSGGAVLNASGEVIGVACMYLIDGQNLNYAVASNDVRALYENRGEETTLAALWASAAEPEPEPTPAPQPTKPAPQPQPTKPPPAPEPEPEPVPEPEPEPDASAWDGTWQMHTTYTFEGVEYDSYDFFSFDLGSKQVHWWSSGEYAHSYYYPLRVVDERTVEFRQKEKDGYDDRCVLNGDGTVTRVSLSSGRTWTLTHIS